MIPIINFAKTTAPVWRGLVELDVDPDAERVYLADRNDMSLISHNQAKDSMQILVPASYATGFDLMVLIFDDAGATTYNLAGNDKVQAQLVDARTVTLNP